MGLLDSNIVKVKNNYLAASLNNSLALTNIASGVNINVSNYTSCILGVVSPGTQAKPYIIEVVVTAATALKKYTAPVYVYQKGRYYKVWNSGKIKIFDTYAFIYLDCNGASGVTVKSSEITTATIGFSLTNVPIQEPSFTVADIISDGSASQGIATAQGAKTVVLDLKVTSGEASLHVNTSDTSDTPEYYLTNFDFSHFIHGKFPVGSGKDLLLPVGTYRFFIPALGGPTSFLNVTLAASGAASTLTAYSMQERIEDLIYINEDETALAPSVTKYAELGDYTIYGMDRTKAYDGAVLEAVYNNIAVFFNVVGKALYISTEGLNGFRKKIDFNSTHFPNLISGSTVDRICIIPWSRRTSNSTPVYNGNNWRIVVFTSAGQIYHNFPSRANGYDGAEQSGDEWLFDESVVWDLPERTFPTKTNTGDDATLIATGQYRYCPCLPDSMYEKHPGINVDNGYGNGGFGAICSYTDKDGTAKKRSRFFVPWRGTYEANSFNWLSGYCSDKQVSAIGTYLSNTTYSSRLCVFLSNDGREWFVAYEYGPNSRVIDAEGTQQSAALNQFSEYGSSANVLKFGNNSVGAGAYSVRRRSAYVPSASNKEPEHKFLYDDAVAVSSIVSSSSGIVVTTAANHGLSNGDAIVFDSVGGDASWDWILAQNYTQDDAGNGVIWRAKKLSDTSFQLMLEVKNPYNPLLARHIHTLNRQKDGYIIGTGEFYPQGWVEFLQISATDTYDNLFAGNKWPVYRLNSSSVGVQRILGAEFDQDGTMYFGLDASTIQTENVQMPIGRTTQFRRNSTGVFKGNLTDIDDFSSLGCVFETDQPAYFFKRVQGIFIFVGSRGIIGISKDGETWHKYQSPFADFSWLMGVTDKKEICLRPYAVGNASVLIIKCKN